jgi:hypothetical protein
MPVSLKTLLLGNVVIEATGRPLRKRKVLGKLYSFRSCISCKTVKFIRDSSLSVSMDTRVYGEHGEGGVWVPGVVATV